MVRPPPQPLAAVLVTGLVVFGAACAGPSPEATQRPGTAGPAIDLAAYRLVDLTHPLDADTIYWPTSPTAFELEELHHGLTAAGFFYASNRFSAPEHGGTHLDAPIHFAEGRWTADQVPLERLVAPAVVLDVSRRAAADPDYRLTPADVAAFEAEHGAIPSGSIVLLKTGWGERWGDRRRYLGDDTPGDASNLHFPAYGLAAAELLVEGRGAAVLGVDTASLDHGPSTDFPVHRVAAAANVSGLENVARLDELPPTGAWLIALPMKIAGGSGGPVRIAALVPR
jgi:kynurenine formamidase